jgi:lysophospholipase L1-like esterase
LNYPEIIAQTGWTTDELAGAIEREKQNKQYNLVTLLIGVNNQYRGRSPAEYQIEFRALLQTAIDFANNNARNVIVVSIPDYGVTPFGKNNNPAQIAQEIDAFNAINLAETENANARYVDITPISREASNNSNLIANDGLHPSAEMYKLWVKQILPHAQEILNSQ